MTRVAGRHSPEGDPVDAGEHSDRTDAAASETSPEPGSSARDQQAAFGGRLRASARVLVDDLGSVRGLMLLLCLILRAAPSSVVPGVGVDNGWATALNVARQDHLKFGRDIEYTYGPWGLLDSPLATNRVNLILGIGFAVFSLAVAWFALRAVLARYMGRDLAAIASTVVIVLVMPGGGASSVLVVGLIVLSLDYICPVDGHTRSWCPAFAAVCAALVLQIKFSDGLLLTILTGLVCAFAPDRRVRRAGEALVAFVIATVLAWLIAAQSLSDLPNWFEKSVALTRGYTEAMATDYPPHVLSYVLIGVVTATLVASYVAFARTRARRPAIGIGLLALAVVYTAFREATGRHDGGHEIYFYLWAIPILAWFLAFARSKVFGLATLALSVLVAYSGVSFSTNLGAPGVHAHWSEATEVITNADYQALELSRAHAAAQDEYDVPDNMRQALEGHPMAVDGSEATLPWAYGFTWRPAPLFQSYVAFTSQLDAVNANWLRNSPSGQMILRPTETAIDGRNSLWDPPQYVLAEMCNLDVVSSSASWLLMAKRPTDRCGAPTSTSSVRVSPGQVVTVPAAGPSQLITMSFDADQPGLLTKFMWTIDKPATQLYVTADGASYRLPRALAGESMVVSVPAAVGWPAQFGGATSYQKISFTESGTVHFSVVNVTN